MVNEIHAWSRIGEGPTKITNKEFSRRCSLIAELACRWASGALHSEASTVLNGEEAQRFLYEMRLMLDNLEHDMVGKVVPKDAP